MKKKLYRVKEKFMTQDEIDSMIAMYGDRTDELGFRLFDPNNPEHLRKDSVVEMACLDCSFEEDAPAWVISEASHINNAEFPVAICPKCNGRQIPKDCIEYVIENNIKL